jgi:hypothetical protein
VNNAPETLDPDPPWGLRHRLAQLLTDEVRAMQLGMGCRRSAAVYAEPIVGEQLRRAIRLS